MLSFKFAVGTFSTQIASRTHGGRAGPCWEFKATGRQKNSIPDPSDCLLTGSGIATGMSGEEVLIVPYQDGPYLVRGPVVVRDQAGGEIKLSRHPVALCRCGKSRIRPFCDGTHRLVHFAAPSSPETHRFEFKVVIGRGDRRAPTGAALARPCLSSEAVAPSDDPSVQSASDRAATLDEAGSSAVRRALARVRDRLGTQLETGPHLAREHNAMRSAEPLIGAAWLLLGERRSVTGDNDPQDVKAPVSHLIRGALELLVGAASDDESRMSALSRQLEAALALLERGPALP
ncbi:MAG TPA: CDGSH iron-sulfur domain-containing protein [Solirubrobacteraceae bacterium]|jgi:CDGSH-type Zn-finger protein|nr:CDGSH iron-sulfur domain-containing protein [Solirubrobacteraceae bacterium]